GGLLHKPHHAVAVGGSDPPQQPGTASPSPSPQPPGFGSGPVTVTVDGFFPRALLDRTTPPYTGSAHLHSTHSARPTVQVWIVSDFVRRPDQAGRQPSSTQLAWARAAIRDSDDDAAQSLFNLGGGGAVVGRLISTCGLTATVAVTPPGQTSVWWSYTRVSARDMVRMGLCVADGRAAGAKWTPWVLNEMANVRGGITEQESEQRSGGGRWGIIDGLPAQIVAQGVSIKNGWTLIYADNTWRVNCLAVHAQWVLAVLT